jgi:two-component sensor histidine kinase/ligand-binding sensor domain-containing protein
LLSTNITSLKFTGYVKINDKLLISTDAGLVEINIKDKAVILQEHNDYNIPSYLYRSNIHCISTSTEKILFSGDRGLYSINKKDKRIQQIQFSKNYDDRKWLTLTNCIFQTHDNIWIGSQYGVGWLKNLNSSFTGYYNSMDGNGIMIEHSITLFNINDSVIGICGDDGLYFSNHLSGKISKYSVTDFYYHAFKLPDGNILASGENKKIQIIDNSGDSIELTKTYPELKEIRNDLLMSSAFLDDSICFMASQNEKGIYIWNLKTKKITILNTTSGPVSLKSPIINRLFIDSQKRLWIVGDNTISIYNHYKRQVSHLNLLNPRNNDPLSINMDICEAGGKFWIATYGTGIIELSGSGNINRIYSAADGINNLGLYKIFKLSDSALIVSSNSGLSLLNFKTGKVTNYFDEAGLNSNNFEESSGCENEKYIFLGGLRGYTKIDKRKLSIQTSFNNLYFSSSLVYQPDKITDTSNLFLQQIKVPGNYVQVVVNFNYLNYASPEKTKFQYRLKGINNSWTPTDTKKSISLSSTPPGTYQLQLQASNEAGDWSDPVELTLIFLPKWYQTFWFRSILAILFIGSIYGLYRIRINQIKKEQKIRSKLASDIHDDLGSTLNSVKVYANLALMDKDKDKYLHKVKENIQEALTGVKDIIWVLDDSKDTVEYLLSRVNQFAAPICEANGINYKQKMSDDVRDYKLLRAEKRNLYMILKEAVNNACKYAGASDLSIEVGLQKKRPVLIISDSGKGFDETFIQEGNGLKNMQIRSKEIKYQLIIQSSHSKGTFIQLKKI